MMQRSVLYELETALLHLLQAEDRATLYHYPPDLIAKIKLLKRAVYRVRGEAEEFSRNSSGTIPAVEHHPTTSASGAADGSHRGSDAITGGGQTSRV